MSETEAAPRWRIERVGPAHAEVLALLHEACGFAHSWSADSFAALLAGPGVEATIATDTASGRPAALLLTRRAADEAEILTLGALPALRRQGAARALLRDALQKLAMETCETVWLEVAESNAAALMLYRGLGFTTAGRRKDYYETGGMGREDALLLGLAMPRSRQ